MKNQLPPHAHALGAFRDGEVVDFRYIGFLEWGIFGPIEQ